MCHRIRRRHRQVASTTLDRSDIDTVQLNSLESDGEHTVKAPVTVSNESGEDLFVRTDGRILRQSESRTRKRKESKPKRNLLLTIKTSCRSTTPKRKVGSKLGLKHRDSLDILYAKAKVNGLAYRPRGEHPQKTDWSSQVSRQSGGRIREVMDSKSRRNLRHIIDSLVAIKAPKRKTRSNLGLKHRDSLGIVYAKAKADGVTYRPRISRAKTPQESSFHGTTVQRQVIA